MIRICLVLRLTVHSPRGLQFQVGADEAVAHIRRKYGSRWLGASQEFLNLGSPSAEFLPFYYCQGTVHGIFRGTVSYSDSTTDSKGNMHSGSRHTTTAPQPLNTIFGPNQTQIYAGYKYNIRHVHTALRNEENPLYLRKMSMVDATQATINLFEQSTATLKLFVEEEVKRQATETARAIIRSFHPGASTIGVEFLELNIRLEEVTPVFVPCYVVKAQYDRQEYTLYVSGTNGTVSGPFLINALYAARLSALSVAGMFMLLWPNKVTGLALGSLISVPVYYIAFYAAKMFPSRRRDYFRWQRKKLRMQHEEKDRDGFRPHVSSKRVEEEYRRSSYWDTHAFQNRQHSSGPVRDSRGYYRALGLTGTESVNEIRSAYRKRVLTEHPDAGGSSERMAKLNEAYRVLRDPERRAAYDMGN
ncbi:putative DnaJ chaperone protein [Trypanosoma cruzi]|uniref:DnaJ chaperone protein, putative n=2 Tax=Trypanosoma cruzi TaxID=5693 RepID=Q4CXP5_TRYCC|nr:DnaJ chaperone protein, putative [Trypanosoma cruzi]EAN85047.1 DnaJ chaperone protein, putative [Trypanosoma cruzi]PWU99974.1 putative DnaJ chaperone protein [Trypanosoma cruzi]RNC45813.1 putative DnaJ chaperone protein [Trypanosoma cruzi]|eukprot:XP_806898.1 DnaJ chaperone protein [Trypanosoma cruzi strain CL Brener]